MVVIEEFPRLGNTLFLIATAEALAKENNDEVALSKWKYAKIFNYHLKCTKPIFEYKQNQFHFEPIQYYPNIKLNGYFQSEKFFIKHTDYIRKIFTPIDQYIYPKEDRCAIHIRRGDYLDLPNHHPVLPMVYYEKAIDKIMKDNPEQEFVVFSDDPNWCKQNFQSKIFEISEANEINDFCRMQSCTKHIIANSSFSWWSAWLSNGEVYSPSHTKWFGPSYSNYNTNDIIPNRWTQITF